MEMSVSLTFVVWWLKCAKLEAAAAKYPQSPVMVNIKA